MKKRRVNFFRFCNERLYRVALIEGATFFQIDFKVIFEIVLVCFNESMLKKQNMIVRNKIDKVSFRNRFLLDKIAKFKKS